MYLISSIYKPGISAPRRQQWALCCASSVLLTLVSIPHALVHAQNLQGIDIDTRQLMVQDRTKLRQEEQSQLSTQTAPLPLSESALQRITNLIKNLSPTGRELVLSKSYTSEERQQILTYMEAQTPKTQAPQQAPKQPQLTLEQQRQLMEVQQPVKEEIKKTEAPTSEQQKQLLLTQQLEQQKKIEQVQTEKAKEQIKQTEKLTPEQQKQLLVKQQSEPQPEKIQPQQLTEVVKQFEKTALEQPKQFLPTTQTGSPALPPPNSPVQLKLQTLRDAGVFSSSSATTPVLDATMTRAQFAMIAAKLQEQAAKSGGTFSDIPSLSSSEQSAAQTIGTIEGVSKPSLTVVSDDKKTSVDFMALLAAYSKGKLNLAELDQLIAKIGSATSPAQQTIAPLKSDAPILNANKAVEGIVVPAATATATAAGIAGITAGALSAMQMALAAAQAAAISASSSANNIDLETAVTVGANYSVLTPRANFPTNLNATFNGRMSGTLSDSSAVGANLTMNVNFNNIGNGTPIGGNVQFDNNKGSASFNSVAYIGGFVGGGMSGTYNGEAMNGFIRNAQFFGPAANAVKGSWDMTTNSVSGGGSFAATR